MVFVECSRCSALLHICEATSVDMKDEQNQVYVQYVEIAQNRSLLYQPESKRIE